MLARLTGSHWFHIALLLALLCVAVAFSFSHTRWREQIRNFTFDNYNIMKPRVASDDVLVIDIDEASIKKIGQMPWPRDVMASLVTSLKKMGASVIVFDIVFSEPDRTSPDNFAKLFENNPQMQDISQILSAMPKNDETLGSAINAADNVVTGFSFTNELTDSIPLQKGIFRGRDIEKFLPRLVGATVNLKSIAKDSAGSGSFFVSTDTDGIIRRVPMLVAHAPPDSKIVGVYPSLSLETIRVLDGDRGGKVLLADPRYAALDPHRFGVEGIEIGQGKRVIPTNARGEFIVYFAKSNPAWYIPAWQVLDKALPGEKVKGKIVFIGTSSVGLKDIRSTPLNTFVPGVEVHLNIVDQILQGKYLTRSMEAEGIEAVSIFLVGLFLILFAPFIGALSQAVVVIGVITGGVYAGFYAFNAYGLLIDITYPAFSVLAIFMLSTILTYLRTEREKRAVRQAFGLYISPDFMAELTRDPDKLRLGGETRELSVMFSDIRNFTTISEGMKPEALIQMMNDFLTPMSEIVMSNRGTIDKYIGDAMMAFWNAPLDDADHARHACLTALQMVESIGPVNEGLKAKGVDVTLTTGIGINTGSCAVGNMGSKQRFAYSTVGDAVNLAARLEGQTKAYGVPILIGENTYEKASSFAALELDLIIVKGKTKPVRVYALLGDEKAAQDQVFKALKAAHDEMMAGYRAGNFEKAIKLMKECDAAKYRYMSEYYGLFSARAAELKANPPKEWSGVYEAKSK